MSMTTELAQRMKAAALRAKAATEDFVANRMSMSVCLEECAEFNDLSDGPDNMLALVEALEARDKQIAKDAQIKARLCRESNSLFDRLRAAEKRIAELERMESTLRPVGVMSQKAYRQLENRESRFIALWPRPEIYLPRKRPDDGVIVYARTAGIQVIEGEQNNG